MSIGERVATFERVSSDKQDVSNQRGTLDGHCAARGYEITRRFTLPDTSAYKGKHATALAEILADVAAGQYTRVVAVASSRFERRGVKVGLAFALELDKLGGRLESCDNPVFGDMSNLAGWVTTIVASDADNSYSKAISANTSRAFRRMDDSGAFRGAVPAGYQVTGDKYGKRLVPLVGDGALITAQDVRDAFKDAERLSTVALAKRLRMSPDGVGALLRNRVYSTGRHEVRRGDGVSVIHRCEPLVSPAVQARAIAGVERRRTGDNVSSRALAKDDFSGALWCGSPECGRATMHRYYSGARKRADGSRCPKARRYKCRSCGKSVDADKADATVDAFMGARTIPWLEKTWVDGDDNQAELDRVGLELRELAGRGLDEDAEDAERARLRAEKKRLEAAGSTPGHWEHGFTGKSEGQRWAEMTETSDRRAWLVSGEFRLYAKPKPGRTGAVTVELAYVDDDADGEAA